MAEHEFDQGLQREVDAFETEQETLKAIERDVAFQAEPRPVPEGLIFDGPPPGHIAYNGDFTQSEHPRSRQPRS